MDNLILQDETGRDVEFEFLDLIEYKRNEYAVLMPIKSSTGEVVILRIEDMEVADTSMYLSVENEQELMEVFEIFKERNKNTFHFDHC